MENIIKDIKFLYLYSNYCYELCCPSTIYFEIIIFIFLVNFKNLDFKNIYNSLYVIFQL